MSDNKEKKDLNLPQLLDFCGGVLQRLFLASPEDKSKPLFKEIKSGKAVNLGDMVLGEKERIKLMLALDHSEFVGPGFNFNVFKTALDVMLRLTINTLKAKKELNVLTSEEGAILVHLPGVIELNGQVNVMLLTLEPDGKGQITIKLIFVDPSQYIRNDEAS